MNNLHKRGKERDILNDIQPDAIIQSLSHPNLPPRRNRHRSSSLRTKTSRLVSCHYILRLKMQKKLKIPLHLLGVLRRPLHTHNM